MRRTLSLSFCLILAGMSTGLAAPSIHCDEQLHDFGEIRGEENVHHTFILENTGDEPLEIEAVKATCGCTTTELAETTIPPGGRVKLKSKLSLKNRAGMLTKSIFVHSNDPENPRYQLSLRIKVYREVEIRPQQAYFPVIEGRSLPVRKCRVIFDIEEPVTVTGLKTNQAAFANIDFRTITEGSEFEVVISMKDELKDFAGNLRGNVVLTTDHPDHSQITIPIIVYVRRELIVAPPKIVLTRLPTDEAPVTKTLRIQNRTTTPIAIKNISHPSDKVTIETKSLTDFAKSINVTFGGETNLHGSRIIINVETGGGVRQVPVPVEVWQSKRP